MTLAPEATVGRDSELALLDGLLDELASSAMTCVAVQGDPGIGKTRLLRELRARAETRGHLTLAGSSAEFERDLPFGVWDDALDAHVAALDRSQWDPGSRRGWPRSSPRWARPTARPPSWPTSATAFTGRCGRCCACSPPTGRSCSCSTTCTGATRRRSS